MGFGKGYVRRYRRASESPNWFRYGRLVVAGGAVVLGFLLLAGLWQSGGRFLGSVASLLKFQVAPAKPQVDVRSLVIRQVRDASELTTAVFTMEAVVPTSQNAQVGGLTIGTTRLLYIAYGEVRAGVDLAAIKAEDVQVTDSGLRLRLPPPQILDRKIDVNRSTVYDYNRGPLGLGPDTAPQLQTLAQKEALNKIVAAACADNLFKRANDRARLVVTQLLSSGGYKQVQVDTQPGNAATCATPQT